MLRSIGFLMVLAMMFVVAVFISNAEPYTNDPYIFIYEYMEGFRDLEINKMIDKIWLEVLDLNKDYPDPDFIQPGDIIKLPLHYKFVAKNEPVGADHMWSASEWFADRVIMPYLEGAITEQKEKTLGYRVWWVWLFSFILILLSVILFFSLLFRSRERRAFVSKPPPFDAPDSNIRHISEQVLGNVFGDRGLEIVGEIERGHINGTQVVFYANGTRRIENFEDEPGYRARIRFFNGNERIVVSRWECFNPCWSAASAHFRGTFTPLAGEPEEIPEIFPEEAENLSARIRDLATTRQQEEPEPTTPPPTPEATPADKKIKFTKVQFSFDKGLNLEGDFSLTVKELKALIVQIKDKGAPKK